VIAIIPARGGSKGVPGKNTKLLDGIPLICHTILAAIESKLISRVIVSTDDTEIATAAVEYGAEIPFMRPLGLAQDDSMVMDTYFYTVDRIANESSGVVESFVALLPTAPLRLPEDIDNAVSVFLRKKADSVVSVTEAPIPIQWYRKIGGAGVLSDYISGFDAVSNRQELEQAYVPNGAVYVFQTERLRETRQYYMDKTYPYIMPAERSVDIDETLDFDWAEFLIKQAKMK